MLALVALSGASIRLKADYKDDIGYTLLQELTSPGGYIKDGKDLTGAGIRVAMVEVKNVDSYMPDTGNAEFSEKNFTAKSGASGVSSHATNVARSFFGNTTGIASGITEINVYDTGHWLGGGFLNASAPSTVKPINDGSKVINHSWVGSAMVSLEEEIIRRTDWAINHYGVVSVVGVDNGATGNPSPLMSSSLNSISVGLANGLHRHGPPSLFGTGRTVPHIVAPGAVSNQTSYAAPVVAAGAVLMVDAAQSIQDEVERENALRPEMIKVLLMGGATKKTLPEWSNTSTDPLDPLYGAGMLNVANSYRILASGQQWSSDDSDVANTGWDLGIADASQKYYFFEIAEGFQLGEFTAFMTWNAVVADDLSSYTLDNLDLLLYEADGYDLVGEAIVFSASTGYSNNELIYLEYLTSGRYALVVEGIGLGTEYALTWFGELTPVPEPATVVWIAFVGLMVLLVGRKVRGRR